MKVESTMSKDFTDGYNEAVRDILEGRGMWSCLEKQLAFGLKELLSKLKEKGDV